MEWSEETAFQTVDRRFVNRGGRRFSRDLLDLLSIYIYNGRKGSGKVPHFEEYAFVTPKIGAFLGGATTFCLKQSEGERAERCASERV